MNAQIKTQEVAEGTVVVLPTLEITSKDLIYKVESNLEEMESELLKLHSTLFSECKRYNELQFMQWEKEYKKFIKEEIKLTVVKKKVTSILNTVTKAKKLKLYLKHDVITYDNMAKYINVATKLVNNVAEGEAHFKKLKRKVGNIKKDNKYHYNKEVEAILKEFNALTKEEHVVTIGDVKDLIKKLSDEDRESLLADLLKDKGE